MTRDKVQIKKDDPLLVKTLPFILVLLAFGAIGWLVFEYIEVFGQFIPSNLTEAELKKGGEVITDRRGEFGTLGDAFGGLLNPLFTLFTMLLLLLTIRQTQKTNQIALKALEKTELQIEQTGEALQHSKASMDQAAEMLNQTKQQIAVSVEEMALTREELAGSKAAQEEISKTQKLQQQENALFSLLNIHHELTEKVYTDGAFGKNEMLVQRCINGIYRDLATPIGDRIHNVLLGNPPLQAYLKSLSYFLKVIEQTNRPEFLELIKNPIGNDLKMIVFACCSLSTEREDIAMLVPEGLKVRLEVHKFFDDLIITPLYGNNRPSDNFRNDIMSIVVKYDPSAFADNQHIIGLLNLK